MLRLWVSAEDYRDDIRLSDEILTRLAATPTFMGGDPNLEKIELNGEGGNSDQNGCIVR